MFTFKINLNTLLKDLLELDDKTRNLRGNNASSSKLRKESLPRNCLFFFLTRKSILKKQNRKKLVSCTQIHTDEKVRKTYLLKTDNQILVIC